MSSAPATALSTTSSCQSTAIKRTNRKGNSEWYDASHLLPKDEPAADNEDEYLEDEVRDAILVIDEDSELVDVGSSTYDALIEVTTAICGQTELRKFGINYVFPQFFEGHNSSIIAYGARGSGKIHLINSGFC
ncbi:hypothetical protein K1719_003211 [Acacia pycnantha]|nr:hypothetical protein K1719_003211 [Acacia pycnantha]